MLVAIPFVCKHVVMCVGKILVPLLGVAGLFAEGLGVIELRRNEAFLYSILDLMTNPRVSGFSHTCTSSMHRLFLCNSQHVYAHAHTRTHAHTYTHYTV